MQAGRAEVSAVIERARQRRKMGIATIFFLDEIHRFNKAQQDALLPAVEEGLVTLIGATTENPYFEVNSALLSRTPRLRAPGAVARGRARAARPRRQRGEVGDPRAIDAEALDYAAEWTQGDARAALNGARARGRGRRDGRPRHPRGDRRRPAGPSDQLRPPGRQPLRHDLGLDQGDARLRPRRVPVLPGGDARGRRGPALHRAADGDPRLRGHRQRRPAGACGRDRRRCGGRARRPARGRVRARPVRDLPLAGAEVRRRQAGDRRPPEGTSRARRARRRPATCARPIAAEGNYDYPHARPGHVSPQELLPPAVAGARFYEPDDAEAAPAGPPRSDSQGPRTRLGVAGTRCARAASSARSAAASLSKWPSHMSRKCVVVLRLSDIGGPWATMLRSRHIA